MTWFEQLFGFRELDYTATQRMFRVEAHRLHSLANGRSFGIGTFRTPSVEGLREDARDLCPGRLEFHHEVVFDVLSLHAQPHNRGAMFQAASQFNCLEFAGPGEVPEQGVTQYRGDPTQGPACALAAAAATVYRNYFAEVDGQAGQTRDRQLNNLDGLQTRLGPAGDLVNIRNGYTLSDEQSLTKLNAVLAGAHRDPLIGAVKVGLQTNVDVTFAERFKEPAHTQQVSQVFCSALSCGYSEGGLQNWAPLARIVLDAAYEATLLAAVIDKARGQGSGVVWLTFLGGGAFGNDPSWIAGAIGRALNLLEDRELDVRIAHHRAIDPMMVAAIDEAMGQA